MNDTCNGTIFWVPTSWGLGEGPKGQISLNLKSISKIFNLTLRVFSQMKDIKHIRRDFYSVPWVMHAPGFGTLGCWGVKNLIL